MVAGSYDKLDNTINPDEKNDGELTKETWSTNYVPRNGRFIVIFYFGDDARGQVTVDSIEEADEWNKLVTSLETPKSK